MAYHARANVCRAGVTYAGLAHHPAVFKVGATDRSADCLVDGFSIATALDGSPSTCTFVAEGFTPTLGSDVTLTLGGALIWGGTLVAVRAVAQKIVAGTVFYQCQAIDWMWLMDRYAVVNVDIASRPANQAVAEILRAYTNGGFRTGYIPMELGSVGPFSFAGVRVSEALRRIAAAVNAMIRVKPDKSVDMFQTLPASNALSIGNSSDVRGVVYESSLAQVRTRTYFAGGGSQTTALVQATSTTIPVEECGWYVSGTQVLVGSAIISYSGVSAASGPGEITGCSGLTREIPQGETVATLAQADDSAAQTALATVLGGGRSGIAVGWFSDGRLSYGEAAARSTSDVAFYKEAVPSLAYTTSARYHEPGKTVSVSVTDPVTVSGDFRIQSVVMTPFGPIEGNTPRFQYQVQCRLARRADVLDLLKAS
jgi:hypothetical protein